MNHQVLIVSYSMGVGGVERALLGMLNSIDYSSTDVTLCLARKEGALLSSIPSQVTIREIPSIKNHWNLLNKPLLPLIKSERNFSVFYRLSLFADFIRYKLSGHFHSLYRRLLKNEQDRKEYDLAISYAGPSSLLDYYVANCVNARKKVAWIHFDVDKCGINEQSEKRLYPKFDKIFIVSDEGKKIFDKMFPSESQKSEVFHNIITPKEIKRLANLQPFVLPQDYINIVTVGRISKEKGQDLAIRALAKLAEHGYNVFWAFVGGGNYEANIKELAKEYKLNERITITGVVENPYPYMAQCDIYVQPSEHEGFCITLAEAKLFGMPIVATDFTGAQEQLANYYNGYVVCHNAEEMAKTIAEIINGGYYLEKNISHTTNSDFKKLEQLLLNGN